MAKKVKKKKKKIVPMGFSTRPRIENFKKTAEKFKKLENTIIASFPAKIGQERSRKSENKKIKKNHSDLRLPNPEQKISNKQQKKFKKLENTIIASFQAKIRWERSKKSENKRNRSNGFFTRPGIENSKKNNKKIQKI